MEFPKSDISNTKDEPSSPDYLTRLKSLNFTHLYKKGSYLDVYDSTESIWRVAKVIDLSHSSVTIAYDGWKSVYNETILLTSQKLSPFRSKTANYTGHKMSIRENNIYANLKNEIEKTVEKMEIYSKFRFQMEDPYEITQFLRGELYILIDYILSKAHHPCDSSLIVSFMEIYMKFFNEYIDFFKENLKEALELKVANPLFYLVHDKSATILSFPEMIDSLKKIFGNYDRTSKFFQGEYEFKFSGEISVKKSKSFLINQNLCFVNLFINSGGMEKLLKLIDYPGSEMKQETEINFPFSYVRDSYNLFKIILPNLVSPKKEAFSKDLIKRFIRRINMINARDIKDIELRDTLYVIKKFHYFFEELNHKENNQFENEERETILIVKFIKSGFLEKQLKAMDEIKNLILMSDPSSDYNEENEIYSTRKHSFTQPERLRVFIIKNKIIEYILGEDFHVEILKRSKMIFKFLSQTGGISKEYFDLLWKLNGDIHEANKKTVFETLIELSRFLNSENLDYLYNKLKSIPLEKYDDTSIELLKEFIISSLKNKNLNSTITNIFFKIKNVFGDSKLDSPAFNKLWNMMLDESKLDPNYIKTCINAIVDIFKKSSSKSEKEKYLELCVDYIKKGVSVPQSLILFMSISETISPNGFNYLFKETAMDDIIAKWNKTHNLIDLIIKDLEKYLKAFQSFYESEKFPAHQKANYQNYCFAGKYTYRENIETRLNFIATISVNSNKKFEINIENIKKLWVCFIKKNKENTFHFELNVFINWLLREKIEKDTKNTNKKNYLLPENLLNDIFNKIFFDPDFVDVRLMSFEVFRCFQSLFEYINVQQKTLEINHRNLFRILKFSNILGRDYFWQILIYNSNERILNICKTCLLNLYIRLSNEIYKPEDKLVIWKEFISNCIDNITNVGISQSNLNYITMTLKTFLNILDGYRYHFFDNPSQLSFSVAVKLIGLEPQKKLIQLPSNSTFVFLRKKINEYFNLHQFDFEMCLFKNSTSLTLEHEEDYPVTAIENFRDKENEADLLVIVNKKKPNRQILITQLKLELSNNEKIIEILFNLLSKANITTEEAVWELIKFLPVSVKLRNDILHLNLDGTEKSWLEFLDVSNSRKFLYILEIIDDLMSENLDSGWILKFAQKGGVNYLYKFFLDFPSGKTNDKFCLKLISMVIKLFNQFIKMNYESIGIEDAEFLEKTSNKCLEFLFFGIFSAIKDPEMKLPEEFPINLLDFLFFAVSSNENIISMIMQNDRILDFLFNVFFLLSDISIQKIIKDKLLSLCKVSGNQEEKYKGTIAPQSSLNCFFFSLFVNEFLLKLDFFHYRERCYHFFDFLHFLGMNVKDQHIENLTRLVDFPHLFQFLLELFQNLPIFEKNQGEPDFLLQGILKIFQILLRFCNSFKEELLKHDSFMKELSHKCLFEMPSSQNSIKDQLPPKCKNVESRNLAFNLLRVLITDTSCDIKFLTTVLKELFLSALWRSGSLFDWNLVGIDSDKSRTGYVGLRNLGSTCYMNSLFQQFFMLQNFREALLQVKNIDEQEKSCLFHFQLILEALKSSQKPYYDTRQFCNAYKNNDGLPINVLEQMDVDEFLSNFLEKMENQLKGSRYENIIQRTFGGVLSDELIGKECPHYSEKEELFLSINLQVKNKRSIHNSLESFIQGELLEGPNAYFCEKCSKKVKTLKRVCIKKLPNMLILTLKRFEFNYETMTKTKLNDFCEFPQNLDMLPYTQEFLKDQEGDYNFSKDYYNYSLKGVVIHMGTSDSGHYYSLIQDTSKKTPEWLEFNDTLIKKFDINDLAFEAFGGEDKSMMEYSHTFREKCHNAYLLFYQRNQMYDDNGNEIDLLLNGDVIENQGSESFEFIKADNLKFHVNKILLDQGLDMFFYQIGNDFLRMKEFTSNSLELSKMIIYNLLIVGLRSKERDHLPKNLKLAKELLAKSYELSSWLIFQVSFVEIIKEFLVECAVDDMKYLFSGVIRVAFAAISEKDDSLTYADFKQNSILPTFICVCVFVISEIKFSLNHLFRSLYFLVKVSKNSREFLNELKFFRIFKEFILEEPFSKLVTLPQLNDYSILCELKPIMLNIHINPRKRTSSNLNKITFERQIKDFNYLALILSLLVVNNEIEKEEMKIYFNQIDCLKKIMKLSRKKIVFDQVAQMICFFARDDQTYSVMLFETLFGELNRCDENEMKIYWIVCEELLKIQDSYTIDRANLFIEHFLGFFEKNLEFYRISELSFNYFIKINSRNEEILKMVSQYFNLNLESYHKIERWLDETKDIYSSLDMKNFKISRKKQEGVYAYSFYLNSDKQRRKTEKKKKKLKQIFENNNDNLVFSIDSDEDFSTSYLKIGDQIDYLYAKDYHSCKVEDSMDEMYKIKGVENNFSRWIYYDDENIYSFKKMKEHTEDYFDYYK